MGKILMDCLKNIAFKIAGFHTLKLEVIENNKRAINFYKTLGFTEEGRLREFVYKNDRWLDVIVMGMVYEK
jgi:UDP-4-amino-4,6-dideoxy-N-acetyl-beta-L-altrosamine N-acetyltransferase